MSSDSQQTLKRTYEQAEEYEDDEEVDQLTETSVQGFKASLTRFTYTSSNHSFPKTGVENSSIGPSTSSPNAGRLASRSSSSKTGARVSSASQESPEKRIGSPRKKARGYASPDTYAHLHHINDHLAGGLDIVFCGINPGQRSAELGHHFAHPTNHFWKCLHLSGLTSSQIPPTEDYTLPERFSYGLTNIVDRPTAEASELKDSELTAGVPSFLEKVDKYRPRIVCFVGLNIGRSVLKYVMKGDRRKPKERQEFSPGWQPYKLVYKDSESGGISETLFYAVPSTSGKVQGYQLPDKTLLFKQLKDDLEHIKNGTFSRALQFSELKI